ncbi:MAG: hypothetical protein M3P39_09240 [Actinomycetota bacterium]|nr:hypothetical protein [Actinomycetota bacterium]
MPRFVADVVADEEHRGAARAGERDGAGELGEAHDLPGGDAADVREAREEIAPDPGVEQRDRDHREDDEGEHHGHHALQGELHHLVDDGREGQQSHDEDEREHGDERDVHRAEDERDDGGDARRVARPQVRDEREQDEADRPALPQPREAGDDRLAGGEGVADGLRGDEEHERRPEQRGPEEAQPALLRDVRPQDELPRADPRGRDDHAGPEHRAET